MNKANTEYEDQDAWLTCDHDYDYDGICDSCNNGFERELTYLREKVDRLRKELTEANRSRERLRERLDKAYREAEIQTSLRLTAEAYLNRLLDVLQEIVNSGVHVSSGFGWIAEMARTAIAEVQKET